LQNTYDYSPFGVSIDERTVESDFYRRGFNGMEKDDEFKGKGNSYTTEFRQYDPRTGRWLSLDPKASNFASYSPYNALADSPIIVIDVKGDIIKYANDQSKADYFAMYNLANNDFKIILDKMDKSEIIFEINTLITEGNFPSGINNGQNGEVSYEFNIDPSKSKVLISILETVKTKEGVLADEMTGGLQYMNGELGFVLNSNGQVLTLGYDMKDEIATKRAMLGILEEKIKIEGGELSSDLKAFKQFNEAGMPEKYFSESEFGKKYWFNNNESVAGNGGYTYNQLARNLASEKIDGFSFRGRVLKENGKPLKENDESPKMVQGGDEKFEQIWE
jgi:RHS repeat-associated protein